MIYEDKHNVTDILIIIVVFIVAIIIAIIGIYTYYKSYEAFIAYIGITFLTYSTISLIYTILNKGNFDVTEYNINFGLDITAVCITLILTIVFSIKAFYVNYNYRAVERKPEQYY
jgi:purine-cytosine permease-like protein